MGVVTKTMLHRHMSEPKWTAGQEAEAERLVVGVERELEGLLFGAHITPIPVVETVPVSREGMVATTYPVHTLRGIGTLTLAEGDPLPDGWTLRDGRLWQSQAVGYTLGMPWPSVDPYATSVPLYSGMVAMNYMGGWGDEPALVEAILRKAARRMSGRHSDTVVVTGLNAQAANAPSTASESPNFTEADLAALGRFRALGWGGTP